MQSSSTNTNNPNEPADTVDQNYLKSRRSTARDSKSIKGSIIIPGTVTSNVNYSEQVFSLIS